MFTKKFGQTKNKNKKTYSTINTGGLYEGVNYGFTRVIYKKIKYFSFAFVFNLRSSALNYRRTFAVFVGIGTRTGIVAGLVRPVFVVTFALFTGLRPTLKKRRKQQNQRNYLRLNVKIYLFTLRLLLRIRDNKRYNMCESIISLSWRRSTSLSRAFRRVN